MAKKYRSDAFAAIHETMEALHDIGAIDKQTMREFDDACLTPVHVLAPEEIKAIRAREHISQPVFARYLNVSKNLVSDWCYGPRFFRTDNPSFSRRDGGVYPDMFEVVRAPAGTWGRRVLRSGCDNAAGGERAALGSEPGVRAAGVNQKGNSSL